MRLTPHFLLEEFTLSSTALALGIPNTPTPEHFENLKKLAEHMELVRALFDKVIEITSGYRNPLTGSNAFRSTVCALPSRMSSDRASPVPGALRIPHTLCPVAT